MREKQNRRRVPKGVSTAGRYAPEEHREVEIELVDEDGRIDQLVEEMGFTQIDPEEAMRVAERSAHKRAARSPRLDVEEVAQETLVYYLNARKNARTKLWDSYQNGQVVVAGHVLANPGAYINQITDGIVQRMLTGSQQSPDRFAIKLFRQQVKAAEQVTGSEVTDAEKDRIAARIIAEQPPGRRAKANFHRSVIEAPSGNLLHADGSTDVGVVDHAVGADGRILDDGAVTSDDFEADELGDHLLTIMAEGQEGAVRNARRRAWDAIAGRFGAPLVAPDSVSEVQATKARRVISEAGGIMAVAGRWNSKTASADEANAMFAPFAESGSKLTYEQQERVVASLNRLGAYSDDMFDSALAASTRRRDKTKKASATTPSTAGAGDGADLGVPQLRSA